MSDSRQIMSWRFRHNFWLFELNLDCFKWNFWVHLLSPVCDLANPNVVILELQLTLRDVLKLNLSVTLLTDVVVRLRAVLVGNRKESIDTWHIWAIIHHSITFDDALFFPTISVDKSIRFNINVHVLQRIGWDFRSSLVVHCWLASFEICKVLKKGFFGWTRKLICCFILTFIVNLRYTYSATVQFLEVFIAVFDNAQYWMSLQFYNTLHAAILIKSILGDLLMYGLSQQCIHNFCEGLPFMDDEWEPQSPGQHNLVGEAGTLCLHSDWDSSIDATFTNCPSVRVQSEVLQWASWFVPVFIISFLLSWCWVTTNRVLKIFQNVTLCYYTFESSPCYIREDASDEETLG